MKKNNVRLICTSVASGDKKNYAVVPVKVNEKKIDYTEDEIKALAESILNPKLKSQAIYEEPLEDIQASDEPVEEAQEDAIAGYDWGCSDKSWALNRKKYTLIKQIQDLTNR
jgi:hypothetical protein